MELGEADMMNWNICKLVLTLFRTISRHHHPRSDMRGTQKPQLVNTLRLRQNGRHFADDTFNLIFVNENVSISIKIALKFVPKGLIYNISALVQVMALRRPGDKPLFESMMVSLPTHICVTRPQ